MLKRIVNKIIRKLGKRDYSLDESISFFDLINLLCGQFFDCIRGLWCKPFFLSSRGLIFVGHGCCLRFCSHMSVGKTFRIGNHVTINALCKNGIKIGDNVTIKDGSIIEGFGVMRNLGEKLEIGDNVGISQNCFIAIRGNIFIGSNTIIGPGTSIFSENHNTENRDIPIVAQGECRKDVVIGSGVWIGSNVTILNGVSVGDGAVVGAGSVVTRDIPPFTICAGVPARVIRER